MTTWGSETISARINRTGFSNGSSRNKERNSGRCRSRLRIRITILTISNCPTKCPISPTSFLEEGTAMRTYPKFSAGISSGCFQRPGKIHDFGSTHISNSSITMSPETLGSLSISLIDRIVRSIRLEWGDGLGRLPGHQTHTIHGFQPPKHAHQLLSNRQYNAGSAFHDDGPHGRMGGEFDRDHDPNHAASCSISSCGRNG